MRLINIATILNLLALIFNIGIAYFSFSNGRIELMIFNIGCAICSGLVAIVCAIVGK